MEATVIESSFGVLAFDEHLKLVDKVLFLKEPQEVAKTLAKIEAGRAVEEITELISRLQGNGYDLFIFENANLASDVHHKLEVKTETHKPSKAGEVFRSKIESLAVETGFVKDAEEFTRWMHSVTMEITKLRVKSAVEKRDLAVGQAIQTLDDVDKVANLFMSHIREWYGIHFPELDRLLEKHETYAHLVMVLGNRQNFKVENLGKQEIPEDKAQQIADAAESSMGADIAEADLEQIQGLSNAVNNLYHLRQSMEHYLDTSMEEVAPNVKALVGSLLGARLIALAGGLTNLARKPSSTIQVLGAEKALFRSLKTGTRPPKHGLIFQDTLLHEAKRWQRGKIARALAGKLAIAARADAYGGRRISDELKSDLEKRIKEIREKYREPPPIPERRPERGREMRRGKEDRWRKFRREGRR